MDQQTFELMANYQQVISFLSDKIKEIEEKYTALEQKLHDTESMIFDEIIGPAQDAMSSYDKDRRFEDFKSTYGDMLAPYQEGFAPMEGPDFDMTRQAFDAYEEIPEDQRPEVGDYVDTVVSIAADKLKEIKAALGIPAEADVEIKETDDTVEVKADGETVEVEQKDGDGEATEEEPKAKPVEEDTTASDDGESVEDFEASLKKSL